MVIIAHQYMYACKLVRGCRRRLSARLHFVQAESGIEDPLYDGEIDLPPSPMMLTAFGLWQTVKKQQLCWLWR